MVTSVSKMKRYNQGWWRTALGSWRQKDQLFRVILVYVVS